MGKFVDLTNREFGQLKVLSYAGKDKNYQKFWKCECKCGNITIVRQQHLFSGHTTTCGCGKNLLDDYTGRRFDFLYVVGRADDYVCPSNGKRYVQYKCRCDCGKELIVVGSNLRNGATKSCGCQDPHRFQDLSNREFGELKVLHRVDDYVNPSGRKLVRYRCVCKCGNEVDVLANALRSGDVGSCGCVVRSRGEAFVRAWLGLRDVQYELHKSFPDCLSSKGNRLSYDFWIPELKALIECNGLQHYEPVKFFGGEARFVEQQEHDMLKRNFAENNGYSYLVLDCRVIDKTQFDDLLTKFIDGIES